MAGTEVDTKISFEELRRFPEDGGCYELIHEKFTWHRRLRTPSIN